MLAIQELDLQGRPARVWIGGEGDPLLLVHGGWGGAEMHWATVWDRLAERFRVVAPELPGIGEDGGGRPLIGLSSYAGWLEALLARLGIERAWIVGNSFGAALAWHLVARAPGRCRGLVLVNGSPPPALPGVVRRVLSLGPLRRLVDELLRKGSFSRNALARAFVDARHIPPAVLAGVEAPIPPRQLAVMRDLIVLGEPAPELPSQQPVLLLWGAGDRLFASDLHAANKLYARLPGCRLVTIPGAGHCPQLERPEEFLEALAKFVGQARG